MKKQGILFMLIGGVLIVAACMLAGWNWNVNKQVEKRTTKTIKKLEELIDRKETVSNSDEGIILDQNEYIGILDIPKLNLSLPVMSNCNRNNLQWNPCRYSGTVKSGNLVIAAHNYDCHFGRLKQLEPGDEINFTDTSGVMKKYQVENMQTVNPMEGNKIVTSDYTLTLFTCTYDGTARYVVQCRDSKEN